MIFRGLTASGDWTFGRGRQNYLTGNEAILKNLETKLRTFMTECFFDRNAGVPWFDLLGQKETALLLYELRSQILNTYGITRIADVSFSLDVNRKATVLYNVDTIYSTSLTGALIV